MTIVLIWLLVSTSYHANVQVVERFASVEECMRVAGLVPDGIGSHPRTRCIQARIAVVKP